MFWRDMTLSVWRKKTLASKQKKRLLALVLAAALCSSPVWAEEATFTANLKDRPEIVHQKPSAQP